MLSTEKLSDSVGVLSFFFETIKIASLLVVIEVSLFQISHLLDLAGSSAQDKPERIDAIPFNL